MHTVVYQTPKYFGSLHSQCPLKLIKWILIHSKYSQLHIKILQPSNVSQYRVKYNQKQCHVTLRIRCSTYFNNMQLNIQSVHHKKSNTMHLMLLFIQEIFTSENDYLALSLFTIVCCCFPLSLFAVISSVMVCIILIMHTTVFIANFGTLFI